MIRPNKHAHPDKTLVAAASVLLRRLRVRRSEAYDDLRDALCKKDRSLDSLFLPALNLLFLLGIIEYRPKNDTIEYRGGS